MSQTTDNNESTKNKVQMNKVTRQTFIDLGMWLTHPEQHNAEQLATLLDEDKRLPLIMLANQHYLIGALKNSLEHSSIWAQLDEELITYLTELEQMFFERNQGIMEEALFACTHLSSANIPVIMLKGGASLFNGVFSPISNRFMTDVDLLVPEELQDKANEVLQQQGYAPNQDDMDIHAVNHHHAPALFRQGKGHCCVELHRWALSKAHSDVLSTKEVWQQAIPLSLAPLTLTPENQNTSKSSKSNDKDPLTILQLSPEHQVVLSIAHSELSHRAFDEQFIDWRQQLNLQQIISFHENQNTLLNWQDIEKHFNRCNKSDPLFSSLYTIEYLFNQKTPLNIRINKQAKQHVKRCIDLFVKRQRSGKKFGHLFSVLKGYKRENIYVIYGKEGYFPASSGRLKHAKRHLRMMFKAKYLSDFIRRAFK
ncbi:nucleotidyltransferase family protein [Thalassotalea crassostreae]|uniref:nucleotidyltransferase family protein n=1 Tax=Thalassotalea crassostreae TaxID=1763536 RepID=UPI000837C311|nr:nucleotidyltransferase family protein [Thalassotalea crassostreae]